MKSQVKLGDEFSDFAMSIFHLNGLLMRSGDVITLSIGQSSARWQVLGRIGYEHAPQTVAKIARAMGHARQSVQRIADVLVKEGLVNYKDNPTDRRTQLLELTPQGAEALAAIERLYDQWSEYIRSKLDLEQLAKITAGLDDVGRILEADDPYTNPTGEHPSQE